ncbi:hypothetical protein ACFQZI_13040 [Mucilaginibacter lutimaris]|uniref:Tetratricopeptide repeat protein n=1 Tax=Mucilaginibacter lutimaris TaxID=931629 RepID=A0ABW2ZI11_9SPHI
MDQYVDSRQKEILWDLLANPADNGSLYTQSLERLVRDNPQSGLLQVLLARTGDKKQVSRAAVYYNPRTLHKVVYHPEDLAVVNDASVIHTTEDVYTSTQRYFNVGVPAPESVDADAFDNNGYDIPAGQESVIADEPVNQPIQVIDEQIEEPIQIIELPEATEEASEGIAEEITEAPVVNNGFDQTQQSFGGPENVEEQPAAETIIEDSYQSHQPEASNEQTPVETQADEDTPPPIPQYEGPRFGSRFPKPVVQNIPAQEPEQPQEDIEDDVYDEIVSIEDIGFEQNTTETPAEPIAEARFSEPYVESGPEEEEASEVLFHQPQPVAEHLDDENKHIQEQEERLIMDSAIGADYLSFDKKLDELRGVNNNANVEETVAPKNEPSEGGPAAQLNESTEHQVSRYDDDKMPYTFMWWLSKTRKEHAGTYQPYVNSREQVNNAKQAPQETAGPARRGGGGSELQQQYYENIFSLTSVSGVERDTNDGKIAFDPAKKEDVIIERFIHAEPQIKPLSADKLDNENKAKRSSEDQNDFVTETLARIYCDQMLYHKAIATYKKLILKYPEKKLYFAAQIEQLEKKTN